MIREHDCQDEWIEQAVAHARALREAVRDQPHVRDLVDTILLELAAELIRRSRASRG